MADYRRCPPIICHRVRSSTRSGRARFFLPIPGVLSRAFDRIRYRWNAEFAKTSTKNSRADAPWTPGRVHRDCFVCGCAYRCTCTLACGLSAPDDTRKRIDQRSSRIRSRSADEIDGISRAKVPLGQEHRHPLSFFFSTNNQENRATTRVHQPRSNAHLRKRMDKSDHRPFDLFASGASNLLTLTCRVLL